MSSDHVVVKREWLEAVSRTLDVAETTATEYIEWIRKAEKLASEADSILSAPSPEMVPMSEVQELIKALTTISKLPGSWAIADDALAAFNAKFKV